MALLDRAFPVALSTFLRLSPASFVFWERGVVALAQGCALYWLTFWHETSQGWWIDEPVVFDPLFVCAIYLPIVAMLGVGRLRWRGLSVWLVAVACALAFLGYHAATRGTIVQVRTASGGYDLLYSFWLAGTTMLFIAQALATDSIAERSWATSYASHFETAWRQGMQLTLGAVFVSVLWGLLYTGAALFKLVDLDFFQRLIAHRWFSIPVTTLALAVSLHVTDVQPQIIRGARGLALTLLSWLLPVLVLIVGGFLVALPFVSLEPLWRTHFAARLLLAIALLLVFFVNCAYQDGGEAWSASNTKRLSAYAASIGLALLLGLAAWALALRVNQYGWSVQRIEAAAVAAVGVIYALGYLFGLASNSWMTWLERANVAAAYLTVALILAFLTPLADPGRLMVADQIARLRSGAVTPDHFDFAALKFGGARWGVAALTELSAASDEAVRERATQALAAQFPFAVPNGSLRILSSEERAKRIDVLPSGRTLPRDLLEALSGPVFPGSCFYAGATRRCAAQFLELAPGKPEAVLFSSGASAEIYEVDENQHWRVTANLTGPIFCPEVRDGLELGATTLDDHLYKDVNVGGVRLVVVPKSPCKPR